MVPSEVSLRIVGARVQVCTRIPRNIGFRKPYVEPTAMKTPRNASRRPKPIADFAEACKSGCKSFWFLTSTLSSCCWPLKVILTTYPETLTTYLETRITQNTPPIAGGVTKHSDTDLEETLTSYLQTRIARNFKKTPNPHPNWKKNEQPSNKIRPQLSRKVEK